MASYNPPTEDLSQFNSGVFNAVSGDSALTISQGDSRYLRFPLGQGAETLPSVSVSGSATFNGTTQLIVADDNTNATYYPVFTSGTGTLQQLKADATTGPFSINPSTGDIRFSNSLKINPSGASVAVGNNAGLTNQGNFSVAIGNTAGQTNQNTNAVAIGPNAGNSGQATLAVAIGPNAGLTNQSASCVALGNGAGQITQGIFSVAIGPNSGNTGQLSNAVAIGFGAGQTTQGSSAVAIGLNAGNATQGANAIAIGNNAAPASQTAGSICLNASGSALNPGVAGLFIRPIRGVAAGKGVNVLYYDPATFEVLYSTN
jgi:hypothetical protein